VMEILLKEEAKYRSYMLFMNINKNLSLRIGKLGELRFDKGKYIYVGSARKGLNNRIQRHLAKNKKLFWHIDYLTIHPRVEVFKVGVSNIEECKLAGFLKRRLDVIPGFGCSDCNCEGHLFRYDREVSLPKGVEILWI